METKSNVVKFKDGLFSEIEKTRILSNSTSSYVDVSLLENSIYLESLSSVIVLEKDMIRGFLETLKELLKVDKGE